MGIAQNAPEFKMRAPSVEGGTTYHMSKGAGITIPAKTPHWFKGRLRPLSDPQNVLLGEAVFVL